VNFKYVILVCLLANTQIFVSAQQIGDLGSSNPGDHMAHLCTCKKKLKNPACSTKHLTMDRPSSTFQSR